MKKALSITENATKTKDVFKIQYGSTENYQLYHSLHSILPLHPKFSIKNQQIK